MLISKDYAAQLTEMHSGKKRIGFGLEPPEKLLEFIKTHNILTVLDYGCGKGAMMDRMKELFPAISVKGYDPGIEKFSTFPTAVDLIYSVDVLEHIEPSLLDDALKNLWNTSPYQYHKIACHPAKKNLPDGRNCHLIVENPNWWLEKIRSTIPNNYTITFTDTHFGNFKGRIQTHFEIILIQK